MKKIFLSTGMVLTMGFAVHAMAQQAPTNYQLSGVMRVMYVSDKQGAAGAINYLSQDASRITIRGTEQLGDGLRAVFFIDTGISPDTPAATTIGDRASRFGLGNKYVLWEVGRSKHSAATTLDNYDAQDAASPGSSISTIHSNQGNRINNGTFITITPLAGLSVTFDHALSEAAGTPATRGAGVEYKTPNFDVKVGHYDNGLSASTASQTTNYGAKYRFGKAQLWFLHSGDKVLNVDSTGTTVGISYKLTEPTTVFVSSGKKNAATSVTDIEAVNVGVWHALSKRTQLELRFREDSSDTVSLNRRQVTAGVTHRF